MSIKFVCDVCRKECKDANGVKEVSIQRHGGKPPLKFDICEVCEKKMFKPVKEYRTIFLIIVSDLGDKNEAKVQVS